MAFSTGYKQGGDESPLGWTTPDDIRELLHFNSVGSKQFSIELLKKRMTDMDEQTRKRALKVIVALRTNTNLKL